MISCGSHHQLPSLLCHINLLLTFLMVNFVLITTKTTTEGVFYKNMRRIFQVSPFLSITFRFSYYSAFNIWPLARY